MTKLFNAFSFQMASSPKGRIDFEEVSVKEARKLLADGVDSYIGHKDTAM